MGIYINCIQQYEIPIHFGRPLSFGKQNIVALDRLRVSIELVNRSTGVFAKGWGEVPLNYPWFWPDAPIICISESFHTIITELFNLWNSLDEITHPLLCGWEIQKSGFKKIQKVLEEKLGFPVPLLALQVISSAYDIALYDAFSILMRCSVYDLFKREMMPAPLSHYFQGDKGIQARVKDLCLDDLLKKDVARLGVWHMVGIVDPVFSGKDDFSLTDWIRRGSVTRLKVKLSSDPDKDHQRLSDIALAVSDLNIGKYSIDYNGTKSDIPWLKDFLLRISADLPDLYKKISYIEQPLKKGIYGDKKSIAEIVDKVDLIVDEGAGSWEELLPYYDTGWSGVALKMCKSQTSSMLMFALSKVFNKTVAVMDLTNPSLAQISHVQLASHLSDLGEVESNSIQYCPDASLEEAEIHKGLFSRSRGELDLGSISGFGYGYRIDEIQRQLPEKLGVEEWT